MDKETQKQIKEINEKIREGINHWADIMLLADADEWAVHLDYFPRDLINAIFIFNHVASNIGIKCGRITEDNAVTFANRLRQLVQDMTGYDSRDLAAKEFHQGKQSSI